MSSTSSAGLQVGLNIPTLLTASALIASGFVFRGFASNGEKNNTIVSPRETLLPALSNAEIADLPYPPDALPGARDIASPYGTIRAYEWGPEDGPKVLLIHGISTPCLALGSVAHGLVAKGHRVMLFDLFGRGYSDTPADLDHDIRLFTTQILLVLTSSPLSWTGSSKFELIGYSLGAGISAAFASYFPDLLDSLTLIAPSGLIRPHNLGRTNRFLYSTGLIPETILHRAMKRRLKTPLFAKKPGPDPSNIDTEDAVQGEINLESNDHVVLSEKHPNITVEGAVSHQVDHHEGFVMAFISSIRHGPIVGQHDDWRRIGKRLTAQNEAAGPAASGLKNGKVLIIVGRNDAIIKTSELVPDATEVLEGNVEFRYIEAGHEAPIKHGDVVVEYIMQFWGRASY